MTSPIKSAYQNPAWAPTVYLTGNKNSDDAAQKAAAQYTSVYGSSPTLTHQGAPPDVTNQSAPGAATQVPTLAAAYQHAPDLGPNAPPASGGGAPGGGPTPSSDPFYVDLGAVLTAENQCLNATQNTIAEYESLVATVKAAINSSTVFGQHADGNGDPLDPEGQQFAASTDPQMQQLLNQLGGVIGLVGQINAALNNAGQIYTWTDYSSAFPDSANDPRNA
jgi:hypothetical protein